MPSLNAGVEAMTRVIATPNGHHGHKMDKIDELFPRANSVVVSHDNVVEGARSVVSHFFPDWPQDDRLVCTQFTHGITNKLVHCKRTDTGDSLLVRVYGRNSEILIDRGQEVINIFTLSHEGFAPPLYGRFKNGIVYGFTPGRPFSVDDMADDRLSRLAARRLAEWHTVPVPGDRAPSLFTTIRAWLAQVPSEYADAGKAAYLQKHLSMAQVHADLDELQRDLEALAAPVVFGHNDLLSGNVIVDPKEESVSFIDFEYANYTFRGFDIANHFCEFAGFDCDYSKYPSREFQLVWLREYLESANKTPPTCEEVERLYTEVAKFAPASHFFWAIWALVQVQISDLDFDYAEFAVMRYQQFRVMRQIQC